MPITCVLCVSGLHRKEACLRSEQGDTDNWDITPQIMKSIPGKCLSSWEMKSHRFHVEGEYLSSCFHVLYHHDLSHQLKWVS